MAVHQPKVTLRSQSRISLTRNSSTFCRTRFSGALPQRPSVCIERYLPVGIVLESATLVFPTSRAGVIPGVGHSNLSTPDFFFGAFALFYHPCLLLSFGSFLGCENRIHLPLFSCLAQMVGEHRGLRRHFANKMSCSYANSYSHRVTPTKYLSGAYRRISDLMVQLQPG